MRLGRHDKEAEPTTVSTPFGEDNEAVVRTALHLLCGPDDRAVDQLIHPDYRDHMRPGLERGPASFRALRAALREAFADIELIPREVIVGVDGAVTVRLRFRGLHIAPYAGVEPCGHTVEIDEIHIWRVRDRQLVEHWALRNDLQALRQMGIKAP
jgi:predicted ester cyclase